MHLSLPSEVTLQPSTYSFLQDTPKKLLIGGEWVEAAGGETIATLKPANGEELARVTLAGIDNVDHAVNAARQAFENVSWSKLSGNDLYTQVKTVWIGHEQ